MQSQDHFSNMSPKFTRENAKSVAIINKQLERGQTVIGYIENYSKWLRK